MCDRCREKYLREKQAAAREKVVLFFSDYTVDDKDKPYKKPLFSNMDACITICKIDSH